MGPATPQRRAMALLVVLVLVMLAAFSAYSFMFSMESQYRDARLFEEQLNSQQAAKSGMELAAAILELPYQERERLGGVSNNPELFRARVIDSTPTTAVESELINRWRVSIISPNLVDRSGQPASASARNSNTRTGSALSEDNVNLVFGLENESAKIPISALKQWDGRIPGHARQALLNLPEATPELVDAFLRSVGIGFSITADKASQIRSNESFQTADQRTEDLQLMWLGGDLNCNYRRDLIDVAWSEKSDERLGSSSLTTSALYRGLEGNSGNSSSASDDQETASSAIAAGAWGRYLSWQSGYRNLTRNGEPRIDINNPDLRGLHSQLLQKWPAELADFVILYRQYSSVPAATTSLLVPGRSSSNSSGQTGSTTANGVSKTSSAGTESANTTAPTAEPPGPPNFAVSATRTMTSPLDLINAVIELPVKNQNSTDKSSKRRVSSPFQAENAIAGDYLSKLLDDVTVSSAEFISDRIDISDAPLIVLLAVPGIDRATAEAIVQRRNNRERRSPNKDLRDGTIGWLLREGVVDLGRLIQLEPYLTSRSDVYSCQVVGFLDDRSAVYRSTLTIDARQTPAKLRNLQLWHSWDRGFSTEELTQNAAQASGLESR
jgi:hypothetical protein